MVLVDSSPEDGLREVDFLHVGEQKGGDRDLFQLGGTLEDRRVNYLTSRSMFLEIFPFMKEEIGENSYESPASCQNEFYPAWMIVAQ